MLYLLRGPDLIALRETLAKLCARVSADPALRELNVTRLDGAQISIADLSAAADTWPFMAERRVVVVEGLSRQLEPTERPLAEGGGLGSEPALDEASAQAAQAADEHAAIDPRALVEPLSAYLRSFQERTGPPPHGGGLPCDIVLLEPEPPGAARRTRGRRRSGVDILVDLVTQAGGDVQAFDGPKPRDLAAWIRGRAQRLQLTVDDEAIDLLAAAIGPQTELLEKELDKLRAYAGGQPIGARDVRLLVAEARAANVFELGDKVAQGDRTAALALLDHLMRDGEHPLKVLQLLVRHFRQLVEAREAATAGELAQRAHVAAWVAERAWSQARRCPPDRPRAALGALLAADGAVKQGRCEATEALLLAVLRLSDIRSSAAELAILGRG